jgi:hypothetical protein
MDDKIAKLTVISIKMYGSIDYKKGSFEIGMVMEQRQALGIVNSTRKATDSIDGTDFTIWIRDHTLSWSTGLLTIERFEHRLSRVQDAVRILWRWS